MKMINLVPPLLVFRPCSSCFTPLLANLGVREIQWSNHPVIQSTWCGVPPLFRQFLEQFRIRSFMRVERTESKVTLIYYSSILRTLYNIHWSKRPCAMWCAWYDERHFPLNRRWVVDPRKWYHGLWDEGMRRFVDLFLKCDLMCKVTCRSNLPSLLILEYCASFTVECSTDLINMQVSRTRVWVYGYHQLATSKFSVWFGFSGTVETYGSYWDSRWRDHRSYHRSNQSP